MIFIDTILIFTAEINEENWLKCPASKLKSQINSDPLIYQISSFFL